MNSYQQKKALERERGPDEKPLAWNMCQAMFGPTKYQEPMRELLGESGPIAQALPGYRPRPAQVMLAEAIYRGLCEGKHVIAEAGTGSGKCTRKGTLIAMADGTHRPIEDLVGTQPLLLSVCPQTYQTRRQRAAEVFASGIKKCYKITTSLGREISASEDHRFLTIEGWKRLADLSLSDRLVSMRSLEEPVETVDIPRPHLSLLALIIADGSCSFTDRIHYTKHDPEMQAEFARACESFENCRTGHLAQHGVTSSIRVDRTLPNGAHAFLMRMGVMGKKSVEKFVHPDVFKLSNQDIAFFLGRLFSGDGCVESSGQLSYSTASRKLATDIHNLFLRLGIHARVRHKLASYSGSEKKFDAWELHITDALNIQRFGWTVGPHVIGEKAQRLSSLLSSLPESNPNRDLVPKELEPRLRRLAEARRLSWRKVRDLVGVKNTETQGYSLAKLARFHELLGDNLIDLGNVYWDKIESIESDGKHETFDITMIGEPNFVANGLVVHNSMAGLGPSIYWLSQNGGAKANRRILVSTAMLILQDQYTKKDLPFLEANLGIEFEWCKRKGRSNYLCDHRLERANPDKLPGQDGHLFEQVAEWSANTFTGDLAELPFDINQRPALKKAVTVKGSSCKGRKCSFFDVCHYYNSKARAVNCEIIVVNHALLVLNAALDGILLPSYDAIIIDEAHKLEQIVRDSLAEELSLKSFMELLDSAEELDLFTPDKLAALKMRAELNLDTIENTLLRIVKYPGEQRFPKGTLPDEFADWLAELKDIVSQIWVSARRVAEMSDGGGDGNPGAELQNAAEKMGKAIAGFIAQDPEYAIWGDRRKGKDDLDRVHLCQAPIKVASWMKANLLDKPCVFLSATLATSRGESAFEPFKEAMGIDRGAIEVQVPSPFDYVRNTRYSLGYYPAGPEAPPRDYSEWASIVFPRVELVCNATRGGALVLFTANKVMDEVYWKLEQANAGRWTLLKQGDMSKDQLIEAFKGSMNSVLCATQSFFEGVDIPGKALRCVIIDKIPFPGKSPIQDAIRESFGKDGFRKFDLPWAVTHLKQGVGRLVRTEEDRGLLVLLDPRYRSKGRSYSDRILEQLPGYSKMAEAKIGEIEAFMAEYLGEPQPPRAELAEALPSIDDIFEGAVFDV